MPTVSPTSNAATISSRDLDISACQRSSEGRHHPTGSCMASCAAADLPQ
jgi:hypothetical protein